MVKNSPAIAGEVRGRLDPWVGKIPWRREWLPTPIFLLGEFRGQRSLAGYSPWGHEELGKTEQLSLSLSSPNEWGFPGGSDGKESECNARDMGSIPGSRRSHGERNGYPFQYSCLENSVDRGAWRATVHGVAKSQARLSD